MDALQEYLDAVRSKPFSWEDHHCAIFTARGLDARTGGQYSTAVERCGIKSGADYRRWRRSGRTLADLAIVVLGAPSTEKPRRGDPVIARTTRGDVAGLAVPPVVLCAGRHGIEVLPMDAVVMAWRIG